MSTQEQLLALAKRIGLIARIDDTAGYGVVRVVYRGSVSPFEWQEVFDPLHNAEQSMAVLCWLLNSDALAHWELTTDGSENPAGLRAAILSAALLVVGET